MLYVIIFVYVLKSIYSSTTNTKKNVISKFIYGVFLICIVENFNFTYVFKVNTIGISFHKLFHSCKNINFFFLILSYVHHLIILQNVFKKTVLLLELLSYTSNSYIRKSSSENYAVEFLSYSFLL